MTIDLDRLDRTGSSYLLNLPEIEYIEVYYDSTGKVWINIDGVCVLRAKKFDRVVVQADTNQMVFKRPLRKS